MLLTFLIFFRKPFNFTIPNASKSSFAQKLDHFNSNSAKFDQHYYYNIKNFNQNSSVLYLGSEDVPGHDFSSLAVNYANNHSINIYSLEHRFFGESFYENSTNSTILQYLTVSQVLGDIAHFINEVICDQKENCNVTIFGGGYLGTIAVMFHSKYPHLSKKVIASSPPLIIENELSSYDEIVYERLNCSKEIAETLNKDDITLSQAYVLSESVSNTILYDSNDICSELASNYTIENLKIELNKTNKKLDDTFDSLDFNSYTENNSEYRDYRSWTWLRCNEIGLWHTAGKSQNLRPQYINWNFFNGVCNKLFSKSATVIPPYIFGNENLVSSDTIIFNSISDPLLQSLNFKEQKSHRLVIINNSDLNKYRYDEMLDKDHTFSDIITSETDNWYNVKDECDHGVFLLNRCYCNQFYFSDKCTRMRSTKDFRTITIMAVAVPTLLLIIIGAGVWFCGKREDDEIGARPTLYT